MKVKMKSRSYRYGINGPRSRHRHKYSKYQKSSSMMMLICIKQYLRILSSIHRKVKQHWGWVEKKKVASKKSVHYTSHENHIYEKKVPFQRKNLIVYVIDYHRFWIVMVRYLSVGNSIYCQNRFSYKVVLHLWNSWVYQQSVRRTHISCAIIFFCENIISFCENISTDCFAFIVLFFFYFTFVHFPW